MSKASQSSLVELQMLSSFCHEYAGGLVWRNNPCVILKKCDLKHFVRASTLLLFFTFCGSALHAVGALFLYALLRKVFVFIVGTFGIDMWKDCSCFELLYGTSRSASSFKMFLVRRASLNSIIMWQGANTIIEE